MLTVSCSALARIVGAGLAAYPFRRHVVGTALMQRILCLLILLVPTISVAQTSTPYGGTARVVPGRVEAEHYDVGGEGVAYHDTDATNSGGALRTDGVDLLACNDSGCGHAVTAVAVGEWLRYTVSVAKTGTYTLNARVSSIYTGTGFHLEVDGQDATGLITLPNTGSATAWQTATKTGVALSVGQHVLRLVADTNQFQLNWIELVETQTPYSNAAAAPGLIEAEDYDLGGEGIAYHDTTIGNAGALYRTDDVDLISCKDILKSGVPCLNANVVGEWTEYTINVAQSASYVFTARVARATGSTGGAFHLELDGAPIGATVAVPITGGADTFVSLTQSDVVMPAGQHVLRVVIDGASFSLNWISFASPQTPYGGTANAVPGRIEIENYDVGGEGVAYHDTDATNSGGVYRTDGVDLGACTDTGCGYSLAGVVPGEWLEYTINVASYGNYRFIARYKSDGIATSTPITIDGAAAVTCEAPAGASGWAYEDCGTALLTAGRHVMRVSLSHASAVFNHISVNPSATPMTCTTCYSAIPGRIEAEAFDLGGEGSGYHDSTAANSGGAYRATEGVDIESTTDTGGGYDVNAVAPTEWLNFSVNAAHNGPYNLLLRVASTTGGAGHVEIDGKNVSGAVTIPATGGAQAWQTLTVPGVPMTAGRHNVRFVADTAQFSLNWLQFDDTAANGIVFTATLDAPSNGAIFSLPATIALSATATDANGTVSKVEFYNGATLLGTDTTAPYTYSWASVSAGTYSLTVKAYDSANAVAASSVVSITVRANQGPTVNITAPASNSTVKNTAHVVVAANANDADGAVSKVVFFANTGSGPLQIGTDDTTAPYSVDWVPGAVGSFTLTARAYDNGSPPLWTDSAPVSVTAQANQLPSATITSSSVPANGFLVDHSNASFTATASDPDGTIARVEFYNVFNGQNVLLGSATSAPFTVLLTNLVAANTQLGDAYAVRALAIDSDGGQSWSTNAWTFVLRPNTAPAQPVMSDPVAGHWDQSLGFIDQLIVQSNQSYLFKAGSVSDADGNLVSVEFWLKKPQLAQPNEFLLARVPASASVTGNYQANVQLVRDNESTRYEEAFVRVVDAAGASNQSTPVAIAITSQEAVNVPCRNPVPATTVSCAADGVRYVVPAENVEAERYDAGGFGVGYFDLSANLATYPPRYDDMDIASGATASVNGCQSTGPNCSLVNLASGEWARYSVTLPAGESGSYDIHVMGPSGSTCHAQLRSAGSADPAKPGEESASSGGIIIEGVGGTTSSVAPSAALSDPAEVMVTHVDYLPSGSYVMRYVNGVNTCAIDYFRFEKKSSGEVIPKVTLQSPTAGTFAVNRDIGLAASVEGGPVDADGRPISTTVRYVISGASGIASPPPIDVSASPFTTTWRPTQTGSYSVTAHALMYGQIYVSATTAVITVSAGVVVDVTQPIRNQHFASGQPISVRAELAGVSPGVAYTVNFKQDDLPVASVTTTSGVAIGTWTPPAATGAVSVVHTLTAEVRTQGDSAPYPQFPALQQPTFAYYVDPSGTNSAPSLSITNPVAADAQNTPQFAPGTVIPLRATVSDPDAGDVLSDYHFEVTKDGVTAPSIPGALASGLMTASWTPASAGLYTLVAKARDNAGHIGVSATVRVSIGATSFALEQPVVVLTSEVSAHHAEVGALDGSASADGGTASYTIPITVPPGRAGMQPGFTLNYSSRGGNGIAGMGWSLSGLSSVHRCPQSVDQDGESLPVNYTNSDRLCLDGQRLVKMGGGAYGAAGQTYRTEIDSFARVTQLGGDLGSTATCFKVELKSGEIQWYGGVATGNSCVASRNTRVLMGNGLPLSWLIDKREDRVGNNVLYTYRAVTVGGVPMPGEILIERVDYTGFGSAAGTRSVRFFYETRPNTVGANDWSSSVIGGHTSMQTQRLAQIATYAPASDDGSTTSLRVRSYQLAYAVDGNGAPVLAEFAAGHDFSTYSGRSLLRGVRDCGYDESGSTSSEVCHSWTKFEWQENRPAKAFDFHELVVPTAQARAATIPLAQDTDGSWKTIAGYYDAAAADGAAGAARQFPESSLQQRPAANEPTTGLTDTAPVVLSGFSVFGDVDGDGTAEVLARVGELTTTGLYNSGSQLVKLNSARQVVGVVDVGAIAVDANNVGFTLYASDGATNPLSEVRTDHADINNDGRTDLVGQLHGNVAFAFFNGAWRDPASTGAVAFAAQNFSFKEMTAIPAGRGLLIADFNGDGKPDLLVLQESAYGGCNNGYRPLMLYPNLSTGGNPSAIAFGAGVKVHCLDPGTAGGIVLNQQDLMRLSDFDGNGLPDIWIRRSAVTNSQFVFSSHWATDQLIKTSIRTVPIGAAPAELQFTVVDVKATIASAIELGEHPARRSYGFWMDVNGDGLEDLVSGGQTGVYSTDPDHNDPALKTWTIRLNQGGVLGAPIDTGSKAGFPTGSGRGYTEGQLLGPAYPLDVDGDGRPELMIPKAFAMKMCVYHFREFGGQCDSTHDGGCGYYWCPEDPVTGRQLGAETLATPDVEMTHIDPKTGQAVGDGYDSEIRGMFKNSKQTFNPSVYEMGALHFVQTGPAAFEVREDDSGGVTSSANISAGASSADAFGDGLTDVIQPVGCPFGVRHDGVTIPVCSTPWEGDDAPTLPDGRSGIYQFIDPAVQKSFIGENQGVGSRGASLPPKQPELVSAVVQGAGLLDVRTEWEYYPLSTNAGRETSDLPLYQVPARTAIGSNGTSGYVDDYHYYFASSMPVVSSVRQSNGVGGKNTTRYGYEEAMYNNRGRGFTGFRAITVDSQVPNVESRTRTVFHQKFPLTGQIESMETRPVVMGVVKGLLSRKTSTWRCFHTGMSGDPGPSDPACPGLANPATVPATNVAWFPYLYSNTSSSYDLADAETNLSTETSRVETINAALGDPTRLGYDRYGNLHNSYTVTSDQGSQVFLTSQVQAVRRDYLAADETAWWLDQVSSQTTTGKVTWAAGHQPPIGANIDVGDKTVTASFVWSQDGKRQLLHSTTQAGLPGEESSSDLTYTPYGLPDVSTTTAASFSANAAEQSRFVDADYGADGYFRTVTRNSLGHTTLTTVRPRDGQPEIAKDAVGNSATVVYDAFGQAILNDKYDSAGAHLMPVAYTRRALCNGCDGFPNAVIKIARIQDGTPAQYTYLDKLARTIAVRTAFGNDPNQALFNIVDTAFDASGRALYTSQPHLAGQPGYPTTLEYDRVGRVVKKTEQPGGGIPNRVSLYRYSGRNTKVRMQPQSYGLTVDQSCPPVDATHPAYACFDIYRQTDALGRYVTATDQAGKVSRYWFDGGSHPTAIQGVDSNVTKATYNGSGQRTQVSDPDSGTWSFQYDAAGELLIQTDARGIATRNKFDRLGRMKESATDALDLGSDFGAQAITDTWTYDTRGAGLLSTVRRSLSASGEIWKQDTFYTPQARVDHVVTSMDGGVQNGGQDWNESFAYHSVYGWPRSHVYQSGLEVHQRYTQYGAPLAITDGVTTWQQATSWDGMGNVTSALLGNGLTETSTFAPGSGQMTAHAINRGNAAIDSWSYAYNKLGGIESQSRVSAEAAINATENYEYDVRQRLTKATVGASVVNYGYLDNGNFDYKSDYTQGNYTYGSGITTPSHAGPHAVTQVNLSAGGTASYTYDNNGNVIAGTIAASYDADNLPWQVTRAGAGTDRFAYGPGNQRYRHRESTNTRQTYYSESGYERTRTNGGGYEYRHHLGNVLITIDAGGAKTATYLHTDRLGSTTALSDIGGMLTDRRSYDAFGGVREGNFTARPNGTLGLLPKQNRGFTDHEHLDDTFLIHMNGRVYDYRLGRFLGVDPLIQMPQNSQSLNGYSYIMNNPLAGRDPTGYAPEWMDLPCTGPRWACNQQANSGAQEGMAQIGKSEAANDNFKHGAAGALMSGFSGNYFNGGTFSKNVSYIKNRQFGQQVLAALFSSGDRPNQAMVGTAGESGDESSGDAQGNESSDGAAVQPGISRALSVAADDGKTARQSPSSDRYIDRYVRAKDAWSLVDHKPHGVRMSYDDSYHFRAKKGAHVEMDNFPCSSNCPFEDRRYVSVMGDYSEDYKVVTLYRSAVEAHPRHGFTQYTEVDDGSGHMLLGGATIPYPLSALENAIWVVGHEVAHANGIDPPSQRDPVGTHPNAEKAGYEAVEEFRRRNRGE